MKTNIPAFLLGGTLLIFFLSCTTDYFGFSEEDVGASSKEEWSNPLIPMAYCNKFNKEGFSGILTAYYDVDQGAFNKNKVRLYLYSVPDEWTYPPSNYIQVHAFSISNNRTVFNPTPISMILIKDSNNDRSSIITTLGHDLLEYLGDISIEELINSYSFLMKDINGWNGISLSVFNAKNKPIKTTKVLIPPFPANPHTYLDENNKEQLLFKLHPFESISYNNDADQLFYQKGVEFCKDSPEEFEIPPWGGSSSHSDPIDQLMEDLSFLPGF